MIPGFRFPDVYPVNVEPAQAAPDPAVPQPQADGDPGDEYPIQDGPAGPVVYTLSLRPMPRARSLSPDAARELREEAEQLRARGVSVRPWALATAKLHGVSVDTVYRAIRPDVRDRKRRSDAGSLKAIETEALADIAAFVVRHGYPVQLAIDTVNTLRSQQGEPEHTVHEETVRRHLRSLGLGIRDNAVDRRLHRRWEAPRPLFLWQMDTSPAACWYIDSDETIGYEAPHLVNKSKAGNGKPRVWLHAIIDDFSRVTWAMYQVGNGTVHWLDTMTQAMRAGAFGPPDVWPAYGVPERFYTDQDKAMKSREATDFLAAFEIQRILALPSTEHETNAQAKGKIEKRIGLIQRGFEVVTKARRFATLAQMNAVLAQYLIASNNRVHSSTRVAPFERWLQAEQVRMLPAEEITRRLSMRRDECHVDGTLTIRLQGKIFQLPRRAPFTEQVKRMVPVRYFRTDLVRLWVLIDGEEHEIEAVEAQPDVAGDIKSAPVPAGVELKRELLKRDISRYDGAVHEVFAHRNAQDARTYPIRPREVDHPLTLAAAAAVMVRRGRAKTRLQEAGVVGTPPSAGDQATFEALMAGRAEIPEAEINAYIEACRAERTGSRVTPLRAVGGA